MEVAEGKVVERVAMLERWRMRRALWDKVSKMVVCWVRFGGEVRRTHWIADSWTEGIRRIEYESRGLEKMACGSRGVEPETVETRERRAEADATRMMNDYVSTVGNSRFLGTVSTTTGRASSSSAVYSVHMAL